MSNVYIGIGSNLGDRQGNCRNAIALFAENRINVTKVSSMIETEPWGVKDQPGFINMAVEAETGMEPEELLETLKKIERDMGRVTDVRWGPRLIDLDILFYDDLVFSTPDLEIPHPYIQEREFVLKPLAEIAEDFMHPVFRKNVRQLLKDIEISSNTKSQAPKHK